MSLTRLARCWRSNSRVMTMRLPGGGGSVAGDSFAALLALALAVALRAWVMDQGLLAPSAPSPDFPTYMPGA